MCHTSSRLCLCSGRLLNRSPAPSEREEEGVTSLIPGHNTVTFKGKKTRFHLLTTETSSVVPVVR